jgi:hypothetical protein
MMSKSTVKKPNITCEEIVSTCSCPHCQQVFTSQNNLTRHINKLRCKVLKDNLLISRIADQVRNELSAERNELAVIRDESLLEKVKALESRLASLSNQGSINNNNLNVMCLGSKDDLFQILVSRSNIIEALTVIKNSALGRLTGACQLLEKVYFPPNMKPAIMLANTTKTQYIYYDENKNRIVESNAKVIAKKLADHLQRAYLKSSCEFSREHQDRNDEETRKGRPILEPYDMDILNTHIQQLQDDRYQKKILAGMNIPLESDVINS